MTKNQKAVEGGQFIPAEPGWVVEFGGGGRWPIGRKTEEGEYISTSMMRFRVVAWKSIQQDNVLWHCPQEGETERSSYNTKRGRSFSEALVPVILDPDGHGLLIVLSPEPLHNHGLGCYFLKFEGTLKEGCSDSSYRTLGD
jgi:hypothetical protein